VNLPRRPGPSARVRVHEFTDGALTLLAREDRLATEEPLEVRLAWPGNPAARVAVTMRTPGHDFELAAGFLRGEGVLGGIEDLHTVAYCTDRALTREQEFNVVTVELSGPPRHPPAVRYEGPSSSSSACGVCGKESIDDVLRLCHPGPESEGPRPAQVLSDALPSVPPVPPLSSEVLLALPERLREQQRVFSSTGGLHAAGLFDDDGTLLVAREDIGRHNAVDKVVGSRLLAGTPTEGMVLCVSGRIGFEIVQKAVAAGIGVLAAVGAPSSLAVSLAGQAGLCTVGFLSRDRFVIYTEPERIGV
jgi:FdhD protein